MANSPRMFHLWCGKRSAGCVGSASGLCETRMAATLGTRHGLSLTGAGPNQGEEKRVNSMRDLALHAGRAILARIAVSRLLGVEYLLGVSTRAGNLARVEAARVVLVEQHERTVRLLDELGTVELPVAVGVVVAELHRLEHAVGGDDRRVLIAIDEAVVVGIGSIEQLGGISLPLVASDDAVVVAVPASGCGEKHTVGLGDRRASAGGEDGEQRSAGANAGSKPERSQLLFHCRSPMRCCTSSRMPLRAVACAGGTESPLDVIFDDLLEVGGDIRAT